MTTIQLDQAQAADADALFDLLRQQHLPPDGLIDHLRTTIVARDGNAIVGSAALEVYPNGALLRSVAVASDFQGRGLGHRLVAAAIERAKDSSVPALYLLTTTADNYFPRFGFERIARNDVPDDVKTSVEFTSACPSSAVVMRKSLPD